MCTHAVISTSFPLCLIRSSAAIRKVSSHENVDQSGNESVVCKMIASQKCKNDSDSLGQLDMQLRTSTEAFDYINMTRIWRKRRINTMEVPLH